MNKVGSSLANHPTYCAWWQEIQDNSNTDTRWVYIVTPGDSMKVRIKRTAPQTYRLSISDLTNGGVFIKTVHFVHPDNSIGDRRCAEWIVEKYDNGDAASSYIFGDFNASFTDCKFWSSKAEAWVKMNDGAGTPNKISFIGDDNKKTKNKIEHEVTPSAPGDDGFTITSSSY